MRADISTMQHSTSKNVRAFLFVIVMCALTSAAHAAEFYVAPTGQPTGDGTIARPWDLQTALNHPSSVRPGDTIWLRGGTYTQTPYLNALVGTSAAPIIVRPYQDERASIDAARNAMDTPAFGLFGSHTWLWGIEVTNSVSRRIFLDEDISCIGRQWCRPAGVLIGGTGNRVVNSIIHDVGEAGIAAFSQGQDSQSYGNIIYYVGHQGTGRGHGHAMYTQNTRGSTKRIADNIMFQSFHSGVHAYGSSDARVDDIVFEGNIIFNNGLLASDPNGWGILYGGNANGANGTIIRNYLYNPTTYTRSNNLDPSYGIGTTDMTVRDTYSAGFGAIGYNNAIQGTTTINGNTFIGSISGAAQAQVSAATNTLAPSGAGLANHVAVRPNMYEQGRAHIVVFNWQGLDTVTVNLGGAGLLENDQYTIHDVQNLFGSPVATGTYHASNPTVSLSTTLTAVTPIVGDVPRQPVHTAREFNAYLVRKTRTTTDNTPPAVTISTPITGGTVSGNVALSATATDNIGVASVRFSVDGEWIAAADTTSPYTATWATSGAGTHTIAATATDTNNNVASTAITVTVASIPLPDTTPPAMNSVSITATMNTATATWTTDEPSVSSLTIGETTVDAAATLSTTHSATVSGLQPTTPYVYTLRSTDASGNSATQTGTVTTSDQQSRPGDVNDDRVVNIFDVIIIASDIGKPSGYNPRSDQNNDGTINILDITRAVSHWGATYP